MSAFDSHTATDTSLGHEVQIVSGIVFFFLFSELLSVASATEVIRHKDCNSGRIFRRKQRMTPVSAALDLKASLTTLQFR